MRRSGGAASRLLTALLARQPGACGALGAARALPAVAAASPASRLAVPQCRETAWLPPPAGSVLLGACRHLSTAPSGDEEGPLRKFRLAQTGEGIKECELVAWFVKEGDAVEEFGRVCEVQSDKATIEITSPFAGTVTKLHHQPGDVVQVGDVLADIHSAAGPDVELHSPALDAGSTAQHQQQQQQEEEHAPDTARRQALHPATSGSIGGDEVADRVLTSPAVRRLAREHSISLAQIEGTGPGGRVTKGDVLAYLDALSAAGPGTVGEDVVHDVPTTEEATVRGLPEASAHVAQATALPTAGEAATAAAAAAAAEPTVIHLRGYRKAMVKSMTAAAAIPHFHFCDEVQLDALVELRQALKGDPSLAGTKLTFLPFFMKAAALALRDFPLLNASLAPDGASVLQHPSVNLGVAMNTPHGLAVPNIKAVQSKTVAELAGELSRLQAAAAANKLSQADISGGTFTLSNIGTIGGTYATPLVNPPEVAIMAVGRLQRLPRFRDSGSTEVVAASVMNVSLGADHRVVDGATLAHFAQSWRSYVENPGRLLLHLR